MMGEQQVGGNAWGDDILPERQAELRALFERQQAWVAQPEATRGESVFMDVELTGADVFWLVEASGHDSDEGVPNLHLEGCNLRWAQLTGANLGGAHLEGARLFGAQLTGANLGGAHLEGARLGAVQLTGADLRAAQLARANLGSAQLTGANLGGAHLEGARLGAVQLTGADLSGAMFDKTSHLYGAVLTGASLDQVTYGGVNLTVVDWSLVPVLGDELTARQRNNKDGKRKNRTQLLEEFTSAVRANRVLAVTLRGQGMNEDADRYAYRSQLLQRTLLRLRRR